MPPSLRPGRHAAATPVCRLNLLSLVHGTRRQLSSMYTARLSRATSDRASTRRCYRTHLLHFAALRWAALLAQADSPSSIAGLHQPPHRNRLTESTHKPARKEKEAENDTARVSVSKRQLFVYRCGAGGLAAGRQAGAGAGSASLTYCPSHASKSSCSHTATDRAHGSNDRRHTRTHARTSALVSEEMPRYSEGGHQTEKIALLCTAVHCCAVYCCAVLCRAVLRFTSAASSCSCVARGETDATAR